MPPLPDPIPPLHQAVIDGSITAVRRALKSGADPRALDDAGNTPLGYALASGHPAGARCLPLTEVPGSSSYFSDAALGQCVKLLLDAGADPNALHARRKEIEQPRLPLHTLEDRIAILRRLPLLLHAVLCNDVRLIDLLLRAGAAPDACLPDGRTALDLAYLHACHPAVIARLLRAGTPRTRPDTLAQLAAHGNVAGINAMLSSGVPADTLDPDLMAWPDIPLLPIVRATLRCHEDAALALLDGGADPRSALANAVGLLALAAAAGLTRLCARLLQAGCDPDGVLGDEQSPLTAAAWRGHRPPAQIYHGDDPPAHIDHAAVIRLLLDAGASPDGSPWYDSDFPLMAAAREGHVEAVRLLLDAGASQTSRPNAIIRSDTALTAARQGCGSPEAKARIIEMLTGERPPPVRLKPQLAKLALDPAFQTALDWVKTQTGRLPQPWKRRAGVFEHYGRDRAALEALRIGLLDRGVFAAYAKVPQGNEVLALRIFPSADPYDALRACGTNGANRGLETEAVIDWLRTLEATHPFDIEACGFDFLLARFRAPVLDEAPFIAKRLIDVCPDLAAFHNDAVRRLAEDMRALGVFYLWWD